MTSPAPHFRITPRHAAIAAALCWAGFALVSWLVWSGRSGDLDRLGLLFWRDADLRPLGPPGLLEPVRDLTALGGVLLRSLAALAALAALLFVRARREAALLVLTILGGWIADSAVKGLVGRARPQIVPHLTEAGGMSFPSGHSFNAALVYIAIALAFAAMSPRRAIRLTLIGAAMALSLAIALSRVWLGVHWPSDALAGWLGGAGWAFAASALLNRPAKDLAGELPET